MSIANLTARTVLSHTQSVFRSLGLTLPKQMTTDLESIEQTGGSDDALRYDPRQLAAAVATALDAGRDPATDKTVLTCLARQQLSAPGLRAELDAIVEDRRANVVHKHAAALIEALGTVVANADAVIDRARATIPGIDLKDREAVMRLQPSQMSVWGEARAAVERVTKVTQVWAMLVTVTRLAQVNPSKRPLILAELTAAELAALGVNPSAESAIYAGHRLKLASPAEYQARVQSVAEAMQADAERDAAASRRAMLSA